MLPPVFHGSLQGRPQNRTNGVVEQTALILRWLNVGFFLSKPIFLLPSQCYGALVCSFLSWFLKPLSTSALPSCRPTVMSVVFAYLHDLARQGSLGFIVSLICSYIPYSTYSTDQFSFKKLYFLRFLIISTCSR